MIGPLHSAWWSTIERLPVTYAQFKQLIADFEITPIHVKGEAAGCLLVNGADIHACVLPRFKSLWLTRKELRVLNTVIEKHGYAQTSATTADGRYFVERLGFSKFGEQFRRYEKWA